METGGTIRQLSPPSRLQWGHRLSAMETTRNAWNKSRSTMPSMGPPPFGDGNTTVGYSGRPSSGTFNGATAFRRWKPVLQPGPALRGVLPPMGPPPFGDGNRPGRISGLRLKLPSMGPPPFGDGNSWPSWTRWVASTWSFNGATAFRRWKQLKWLRHGRLFGRTFNGATAFRRWKLGLNPFTKPFLYILQWGHRLSAMET